MSQANQAFSVDIDADFTGAIASRHHQLSRQDSAVSSTPLTVNEPTSYSRQQHGARTLTLSPTYADNNRVGPAKAGTIMVPKKDQPRIIQSYLRYHSGTFFLGQLISLALCGTAVTAGLLADRGYSAPTSQSILNYILMSLIFGTGVAMNKRLWPVLKRDGWKYALMALFDIEGNYLAVRAYEHTSVTSVQVLDCLTIPFVMLLSRWLLRSHFSLYQVGAVCVCLVGVGALIGADAHASHGASVQDKNRVAGDMMVVAASVCYAASNVSEEILLRGRNRTEVLGMWGFFGVIFSGIQISILERDALNNVIWDAETIIEIFAFVTCLFSLYVLVPELILRSSAVVFNLALLSADFYIFVVGLLFFRLKFSPLYILAFFTVLTGLGLYFYAAHVYDKKRGLLASEALTAPISDSSAASSAVDHEPPTLVEESDVDTPPSGDETQA